MAQPTEQDKDVVPVKLKPLVRQGFATLEEHPGLPQTRKYHPIKITTSPPEMQFRAMNREDC